jgi:GNAT superfamily N-acetyltransferase
MLKSAVTGDASAAAVESMQQFASMWKIFVGDRGGADIEDWPGLAIRWADNAFPFWNALFLTEPHVDTPTLTRRPVPPPAHPALRFARVTTDEALQAYADINARAYEFPLEAGRAGLAGSALWKGVVHAYLGYEDGVPVSAAATVANDGCLFLALVATVPSAQRKGYGEATVRKALYEGHHATGLKRTVLHGTDAGFPVYERVGYRTVATIDAYGLAEAQVAQ